MYMSLMSVRLLIYMSLYISVIFMSVYIVLIVILVFKSILSGNNVKEGH